FATACHMAILQLDKGTLPIYQRWSTPRQQVHFALVPLRSSSFPNSVWERAAGNSVSSAHAARETPFREVRSQTEFGNEATRQRGRKRPKRTGAAAGSPRGVRLADPNGRVAPVRCLVSFRATNLVPCSV